MLPAPAQGALAVECRADDDGTIALLAALDDAGHPGRRRRPSAPCCRRSKRAAARRSGRWAEIADGDDGPEIYLRASVTAPDGSDAVRLSSTGSITDAEAIGRRLAADLLDDRRGQDDGELDMTRARKIVGRLSFVGAGPGDPGLLSSPRAWSCVSAAEVVYADSRCRRPRSRP